LIERGHKITVITRGSATKSVREVVEGIEVFKVTFFPLYPFHIGIHGAFMNMLFKSLEPKFNLVHIHSPLPPPIKTSLPIITTVHTSMKTDAKHHEILDFYSLAERLQSMFVYPPIESKLFSISNFMTAVSLSVVDELNDYKVETEEIAVIGNGVNERIFIPLCNPERREKYILYTGILRARKGLFDLLECAKHVCSVHSDVRFFVCGTGPFFRRLEEEVRRRKMQSHVVLLGYVSREKLVRLYQNATVHVVPSHYEGLPTVLLEAMSCGLSVVATDVGGNKEVIANGVNGFLVPPKSPRVMAEVILRLLEDNGLRAKTGRAARKTVEQRYTWDKIADNILECYEKILKNS
jgi:glycosyltransferase involved in cell wall biosynthesis